MLRYNVVKQLEEKGKPRNTNENISGAMAFEMVETVPSLCFLVTSSGQTCKQMIYQGEAHC